MTIISQEAKAPAENHAYYVAAFEDRAEAEKTVDELHKAGFKHDDIGFALRGNDVGKGGMITDEVGAGDGTGAVKGGVAGGVIGTLFGAASCLVIPGIGPVLACGIIASALGFGTAGAVTGSIFGAISALGMTQEEAQFYAKEFDAGKALVAVRFGTPNAGKATEIMKRHGGTWAHRVGEQGQDETRDFRHNVD